ncbi:putative transcriptional regulator [Methanocalculus alkaliphilus]|uniref:DUF7557 family protein n=1 Tax=Methanocalculus alkaliphilus TaxID=768730 RepID=UPI0020A0742B|nr:hypothetical protein [Methanocalculus alkaliphilus]MCP1715966.1 putative transcriptional regulator [Methanocalculus alkaliphilus]
MATSQTIKLESSTKERLNRLKIHPRETYNDCIERLIDVIYDDEPLSEETVRRLDEAEISIKAGKYRPLDDAMRDLDLL